VSDPYEAPENAEIVCRTAEQSVEESVAQVVGYLERRDLIPTA
jgi:adenylylsulfate kinase